MHGLSSNTKILPIVLDTALVSSGVVIASTGRQDLPRVENTPNHAFIAEGDPVKIQLGTNFPTSPNGLSLAATREFLAGKFEENPNLSYGITEEGRGWGLLQAFRPAY